MVLSIVLAIIDTLYCYVGLHLAVPLFSFVNPLCSLPEIQSILHIHYKSAPDLKEEQKDLIRWFYGACISACMPLDFVQISSSSSGSQNSSQVLAAIKIVFTLTILMQHKWSIAFTNQISQKQKVNKRDSCGRRGIGLWFGHLHIIAYAQSVHGRSRTEYYCKTTNFSMLLIFSEISNGSTNANGSSRPHINAVRPTICAAQL